MYRLAILIAMLLPLSAGCNPWDSAGDSTQPPAETGVEDPVTPQDPEATGQESPPPDQLVEPKPQDKPTPRQPSPQEQPRTEPKPTQPKPSPAATPPSPPRREPPAPAEDPAPAVTPPSEPAPADNPAPAQRTVVVEAGTPVEVRLASALSSNDNSTGQRFEAILDSDLAVEGKVLAKPGSRVVGRLKEVLPGGKVKGKAQMTLHLTEVEVDGEMVAIETNDLIVQAESSGGKDAKLIGIATAIGAGVGAIVGGGKGAAIGAAIGGGAGTARVLTTRGKVAALQKEQLLGFRIEKPVRIQVAS